MFRSLSFLRPGARARPPAAVTSRIVVETVPPLLRGERRPWPSRISDWLAASGWRSLDDTLSSWRPGRGDVVRAARADFSAALADVDSDAGADALDRIEATPSLHELWHARAEVFGRIAEHHDQREATRRLAALDRHFPKRTRRAPAIVDEGLGEA